MERVRKKDGIHPKDTKHPGDSAAVAEMPIAGREFKMIAIPPGIPATAWLGVERMKHLLDLKNADLIVSKRNRERRINFAKDVLDTLALSYLRLPVPSGGAGILVKTRLWLLSLQWHQLCKVMLIICEHF